MNHIRSPCHGCLCMLNYWFFILRLQETASGDTELQQQPLSSGSVEGHSGNVQGPSVRPVCGEAGVEVGNREALSTTVWLME